MDDLNEMPEETDLGEPRRTPYSVPIADEPTVPMPAEAISEVHEDFLSEEETARRAVSRALDAITSPAAMPPVSAFDFSSQVPSDEREKFSGWTAVLGMPLKAVAWLAAVFAVLTIAEAVVIGELLRSRPKTPSTVAALTQTVPNSPSDSDPPRSGLGSDRPVPLPGAAAVPLAAVGPASSSQLEVTSDPPGAHVTVDDRPRGLTPVTVSVSPGLHAVLVTDGTTTSKQTVDVVAGGTASLMASFAPAVLSAGWVSIHSPLDLQIREGTSLLGLTSADRLMMPPGRHVLDLSNADAAFQTSVTVVVEAGKTATSTVKVPNGSLSLNALPWASVTIDGQALPGTTPFANLQVPLGPHEIVWTHPQLGERRQTVMVSAKVPVRLVVDLRVK